MPQHPVSKARGSRTLQPGASHRSRSTVTPPRSRILPGPSALLAALAGLAMASLAAGAHAQAGAGADALRSLERQNTIIERQQQERLRDDQQRALPQPAAPGGADLKSMQPQIKVPDTGACREVREIRIEGASDLPAAVRHDVEQSNAGRCLAAKDLEAILATITRSYIQRGFVTTRAYLPAQDLRSGVLQVAVVEGTIERFELRNTGRSANVNLAGAFPADAGDRLDLRDLEQGIDQINSLLSNSATLDLQPGSQPGQSVVVVNNQAALPLHLYLNWDNLGTPSTGRDALSATVSADGLLGLNENIAFTRRQSVPYDGEHHAELSALHVSVPWGYSTLSYDISESTYTNALHLPNGARLDSEGRTLSQSLALDRVVFRDQASRVSLGGRLTNQDSRSFLGGELLGVASRKLSALDLGATAFTQLGGGILNGRVGYVQGIDNFGALEDPQGLPDDLPHAQGRKMVADLGYSRRFDAGPVPLTWTSQFSGQYSNDVLYGLQQMLVGGPSSVRGSLVNALSGDSGYYIRNDLSLPWQRAFGGQPFGGRFYVGYDFGSVSNNAPGVPSGSMSGVAVGAAVQWGTASAEVFASHALNLPGFLPSEGTLWGVRLSFAL